MDWQKIATELVRATRGARTQKSMSRALGYQSNVLFAWESGRDMPSACKYFRLAALCGRRPEDVLRSFGRGVPKASPTTRDGIAEYLRLLSGSRRHEDLGRLLHRDRHAVGRWYRGSTEIPLHEFLRVIEHCTLSLLDFVACLVDPRTLPSVAEAYARLEAARQAASRMPWSHAIVHMVDLPSYKRLPRHEPGWFASRLGISTGDELRCLDLLVEMGRLRKVAERYECTEDLSVDMRRDPQMTRELASFWMKQGAERVLAPNAGRFAFNTFGISRQDFERLKELQSKYFAELRSLVAESERAEMVAVATFQLFPLAGHEVDDPHQ